MLRRFFFGYILSFLSSPPPHFLFSSPPFLLSPWSFRCLCCVSVLCRCRLFSILCCRRFLCFVLSLVAAAGACVAAAFRGAVYLTHGAPWHRHVELVVARRQRSITLQPAHQGVFEGARNPAPHVASVLARLEPTRCSPVARVGDGAGRAPVPVPARVVRHDRANSVSS